MGDIKGFLKVKRKTEGARPVGERIKDFCDTCILPTEEHSKEQASRCMDCGTPFCHWGCPVGNYVPEWNDYVFHGEWMKAFQLLQAANNLPEITGRLCPAICEYACVLGINDEPITIRENELAIIEFAFKKGWVLPCRPRKRTGKKIAIVGSGPAGISCASELNKAGHNVTVFEKDDRIGGILRYGIPNFKLEKWIIDRRLDILRKEGIKFTTGVNVGSDLPASKIKKDFDAVCLSGGSRVPRDLKIEGRNLEGIHFAMDYLVQTNKRINGDLEMKRGQTPFGQKGSDPFYLIDAKGKNVVVIGGGDTGADCIGCAHRQGAASIVQLEILPKPPECRTEDYPWPKYPLLLKCSTSHEEGGRRQWQVSTKKFIGENGTVKKLSCVNIATGAEFELKADLVILALGFVHPEHEGLIKKLRVQLDSKGNVKTDLNYMTSLKGVFAAGDVHRGQSLICWAIAEGRSAAHHIDKYLTRNSCLPWV